MYRYFDTHDATKQLARFLLATAFLLFVAWIARLNFVMHDMYHEMALVREAMLHGALPIDNPFAFTPTAYPSVHHEWAMGLLLYGYCVSTGWGLMGLSVLRWLLIGGTICAIYLTAQKRGANPMVFAALSVLVLPVAWVGFGTLRAGLVTLFFTAVQLRLMEEDRRGSRGWVLLLLPLWVIWINIHAGFLVGAGLLVIDTAERVFADLHRQWENGRLSHRAWIVRRLARRYWHRIGLMIAGAAVLGLTPYGIMYIPFVLHAVGLQRPEIAEWGPLWTTYQPELTLLAFSLSIVVTCVAVSRMGWRNAIGVLSLLVTAYLALRHIRHGAIFGVVWMCYAPAIVSRTDFGGWLQQTFVDYQRATKKLALGLSVTSMVYFLYWGGWYTYLPVQSVNISNQPAGVVEYLQENRFTGNVMTPFGAGAYVMWHMYPDVRISIDGRYEVGYPPELLDEHRRFYRGEGRWQEMLSRYPSDLVIVPQTSPMINTLQEAAGWELVYQDDSYALMTRPGTKRLPQVDRRGETLPQKFL